MPRILIVEDSPTQAEELRLILETNGFEVEKAANAEEGIERLRASRFDLAISDIVMPGLSGYDFCRAVKSDPMRREMAVILLTTLSDPMDIIQGLECGADNFITKPYEPANLISRVQTILENRRLRATGKLKVGVEILFLGRKFIVNSDKEQILDLLVSTFEDIVRANRELQARQRELAAANKELEAFSYSVSHDLRAPLRSIQGFSRSLLEDYGEKLDSTGRGYLDRVNAAAQRMSQLIDDMLKLAGAARAALNRSSVDLSELALSVADEFGRRDPSRRTEWSIMPDITADADAKLARIILENLLGNAAKFTQKKARPRVEFGMRHGNEGRVYYVRDNGAGFDMSHAQKLFAPFQRLHSDDEFEGTGVGLATVQRIVHRHGGRVWAEGQVDVGATIYFTFGSM